MAGHLGDGPTLHTPPQRRQTSRDPLAERGSTCGGRALPAGDKGRAARLSSMVEKWPAELKVFGLFLCRGAFYPQ